MAESQRVASASPLPSISDPEATKLIAWIETRSGGRVVSCVRQGRWRPAWFITLEAPDGQKKLYARGDRPPDIGVSYPLEYEIRVHDLLEAEGVPIPPVFGFCPDPRYMVMDQVGGRANLGTAHSEEERVQVMSEYIAALARIHCIPLDRVRATGFPVPESREGVALDNFSIFEQRYLETKLRPDPLVEFGRRWVRSHLPAMDRPAAMTVYDAGQFHFGDGHLVSLLDMELAHVGDPLADIAALAMRDTVEPLGNLAPMCELYERLSGNSVDARIVAYHTIKWSMITPLCTHVALHQPTSETDLMTYLTWYVDNGRWATEGMAELSGIRLEPIDIPPARPGPRRTICDHIDDILDHEPPRDDYEKFNRRRLHRLLRHLRRADEIGAEFEQADLDDTAKVLGTRPANMDEADARLESFVIAAGPEHDEALIRLFDRRLQRLHALLGPPDSRIVVHPPIQKLGH
jgi:aminoglycoside phosphotransferase (APT) family kinase protein